VVWFLAVLFLFSLVSAAWRGLTRHRLPACERLGTLPSSRAITVFIFALGLVSFFVRIWWPAGWIFQPLTTLGGSLPQDMSLSILGLVAYRRKWFFELSPRMGRDWSLIAFIATLIFAGLVFPSMMQAAGQQERNRLALPWRVGSTGWRLAPRSGNRSWLWEGVWACWSSSDNAGIIKGGCPEAWPPMSPSCT
jgi:hypothetical protein